MIEVLKSGLYDTIQDLGRFGVQDYGVPYSGAMDLHSAKIANDIVGNSSTNSVLEMTIIGPKLKFHSDTQIALSGADMNPKLNSKSIKMNAPYSVMKDDILSFGNRRYGCRSYLAVKDGFQTEVVLNSYSMCANITNRFRLTKGDVIPVLETNKDNDNKLHSIKIDKTHFDANEIEVCKGLEFSLLSSFEQEKILSTEFTISNDSNRMAYQVNEAFENNLQSIITSLVLPGTIQLTPSGNLMILMRDCQITGGYPRIFQVTEQSINHLSQKFFGEKFRFKCID